HAARVLRAHVQLSSDEEVEMDGAVCVPSSDKAPGRDGGPVRHAPSRTDSSLQVRRRQGRRPRDPGPPSAHYGNPALREQMLRGGRRLDTRKGSQHCPQLRDQQRQRRWPDEANPERARRARASPVPHGPQPTHAKRKARQERRRQPASECTILWSAGKPKLGQVSELQRFAAHIQRVPGSGKALCELWNREPLRGSLPRRTSRQAEGRTRRRVEEWHR
ncbi:hypothetical protein BpHYR1_040095, partial [Brachionus plicatilis]